MDNNLLLYVMGGTMAAFVLVVIFYIILSKKMQKSDYRQIQKLQQGTKENKFSTEILYQKLYLAYIKIPFLKRYVLKLRRRLEIINIDDEYTTRRDTARILTRTLVIVVPVLIITMFIAKNQNILLMYQILLAFYVLAIFLLLLVKIHIYMNFL